MEEGEEEAGKVYPNNRRTICTYVDLCICITKCFRVNIHISTREIQAVDQSLEMQILGWRKGLG